MLILLPLLIPAFSVQQVDPEVAAWRQNLDGTKGQSPAANIHAVVSQIDADVQRVRFNNNNVYVESTGIPSHPIGPWSQNPNSAADKDWTFRIKKNPTPATNHTDVPLGPVGVAVNGVALFSALDARSYRDRNVWHQQAIYFEGQSMDVGLGHPAPNSTYHYHAAPELLLAQSGDNPQYHSPIIAFAFDGYPIYGPYGFASSNGTGGVVRMEPSFRTRNITVRDSLPDGTQLPPPDHGPSVSSQYPLGCYAEDYEFVPGIGHLDEHNGRDCLTPEFPSGTYAYFMTIDSSGEPVYPFILGPTYYGTLDTANTGPGGGHVNVPSGASDHDPFSIYLNDFDAGGTGRIAVGNATPGGNFLLGYSFQGMGPISTAYGSVALTPPIRSFGPFAADNTGSFAMTVSVHSSLQGRTLYGQGYDVTASLLSDPVRVRVR
mgnify:CR=1 FL=1